MCNPTFPCNIYTYINIVEVWHSFCRCAFFCELDSATIHDNCISLSLGSQGLHADYKNNPSAPQVPRGESAAPKLPNSTTQGTVPPPKRKKGSQLEITDDPKVSKTISKSMGPVAPSDEERISMMDDDTMPSSMGKFDAPMDRGVGALS